MGKRVKRLDVLFGIALLHTVTILQIRPNDMTFDVVPAKAEVVTAGWIYSKPQQLAFDARTSETALRVLVVAIGEIPEKIVTVHVNKADELVAHPFMSTCRTSYHACGLLVFKVYNMRDQRIPPSTQWD